MKNEYSDSIKKLYFDVEAYNNTNGNESYWLNLGFWKEAQTVNEACEALVKEVASYANFERVKTVLDVGCGYAVQDIILSKLYEDIRIDALNIDKRQTDIAQNLILEEGVANKINLHISDALNNYKCHIKYDAVIAIESAFHFNDRKEFFLKAFNALKKGGVICLADVIPDESELKSEKFIQYSNSLCIPIENQYGIEKYIEILQGVGFVDVEYRDVSSQVIPYAACLIKHEKGWRNSEIIELPKNKNDLNQLIINFKEKTTIDKYIIIKAMKK